MSNTTPRQHHYIPRSYLRGFAIPGTEEMLWVYDREQAALFRSSARKIARERDYYRKDDERNLNLVAEEPVLPVLTKLRAGQAIDHAEKAELAYYIAVFLMRVPDRRQRALALAPDVMTRTIRDVERQIDEIASEPGSDQALMNRRREELRAYEEKHLGRVPEEVQERITRPWPTKPMVEAIYNLTWRFGTTDGRSRFLTSDNPAFFFRGYGLATEKAELNFPIGTNIALYGYKKPGPDLLIQPFPQPYVKEVNRRVASEATRLLFYHENAPWLATLAKKEEPYLSRIAWE